MVGTLDGKKQNTRKSSEIDEEHGNNDEEPGNNAGTKKNEVSPESASMPAQICAAAHMGGLTDLVPVLYETSKI